MDSDLPKHPYTEYENTPLWRAIEKAIRDLEENQDFQLTTPLHYVVGYLCKQVSRKKLVTPNALKKRNLAKATADPA